MTDHPDDAAFEQQLREVLADFAPDSAPESLGMAVAALPRQLRRPRPLRARTYLAVAGLAAAVVIVVASIGLVTGPRPDLPGTARPAPTDEPTATATPSPETAALTFRVLTPDGSTATKAQVDAVASVMRARLVGYGIYSYSVWSGADRITMPLRGGTRVRRPTRYAQLLGTPGVFSIVLLGAAPVSVGAQVTAPPLVTGDAVTDALTDHDQDGHPTLDLTLDAAAAADLADATRAHVGEYLGIALDGVAIAVPVIESEIPDGHLQLSFAIDDMTPTWLTPILQSGPLPLPVEAVTP